MSGSPEASFKQALKVGGMGRGRNQILTGLGVLALVLFLLWWGLSAMQWTILSTNNDLREAVANGVLLSQTYSYSISQGTERDIYVGISFQPSSCGFSRSVGINGSSFCSLPRPVSNTTTTSLYYVSFAFTNPNGSAVNVWYTGPQGNLTRDCGGSGILSVVCKYSPTPPGGAYFTSPWSNFFEAPTAGNYTLHLLSTQCSPDYNYCTSTNASVSVTRALSRVVYARPYYNSGLATVIVAGVSIAITVGLLSITLYHGWRERRRPSPPTRGTPPGKDVD